MQEIPIVFVHGFNSSHRSFAYVAQNIHGATPMHANYDSHERLAKSISAVQKFLPKHDFILVGHSLGGVIAAHIAAANSNVAKLVLVSAPLGGSKAASTLRWLPGYPSVLADISTSSQYIHEIAEMKLSIPTLSIISTGGHLPTSGSPNDSVVTIESQKALKFGKKVEIKANHFEVLLHERTVENIQKIILEKT